jgi:endonuclease/exonuclease/phosphatase family metal-dependent hydrolase
MCAKILLAALCLLMIGSALHFDASRERTPDAAQTRAGRKSLRLMTWNIGYAELEEDTRAHTQDLKAVADIILEQDPDAVALQELTGDNQLKILLGYLHGRYQGATATGGGGADRVEAVLVKDPAARFEDVKGGEGVALGATFRAYPESPLVVLLSAHADAFSAARRRAFTEELADWSRHRPSETQVFIAGDFNFELDTRDQSHLYTDDVKHDSEALSYLLKYFRDLGREAGDTAINDRRIDYIFGPTPAARVQRASVLRSAAVGRMDHWPLLVELDL